MITPVVKKACLGRLGVGGVKPTAFFSVRLFHCDAFGEISRLVHIGPAKDRNVIGQ
jgi:hypothetical protein